MGAFGVYACDTCGALADDDADHKCSRRDLLERVDELRAALEEAREFNRQMVDKAASGGVLDGYRELGARAAKAEASLEEAVGLLRERIRLDDHEAVEFIHRHGGGEG